MSALHQHTHLGPPTDEMARLHHAGFSLIPLGRGDDGKSPLLAFQGKPRFPLGHALAPMHRTGSGCYGIRLDGLAVIDCDEDDPALVEKMEARFGASPVHVRTPRGRHLYYRASGGNFPNLRGEGLPVDIKRGAGSYVAGPGSVRPDGGSYSPAKGVLGLDALPEMQELSQPSLPQNCRTNVNTKPLPLGQRNYALTVEAIHMVEYVDQPDELFENLRFIRDDQCEHPATMPDAELRKITEWAWSRRLEGKVFRGRDSEFRLHRSALDALKGLPNASDAIALFVTLQCLHGHIPGKVFALNRKAMSDAGHTDLSERRFLAARRALQHVGLLEIAFRQAVGKSPRTYRLTKLHPDMAAAGNVARLSNAQGGGV